MLSLSQHDTAGPTATIAAILNGATRRLRGAAIEDPRLEAEVLLAFALGVRREALLARLRDPLTPDAAARFESLLSRRLSHEPTAYITGRREFFALELECTPDALIPRPETELLVELTLAWVKNQGSWVKPIVADIGTGNAAIAVALAVHTPRARIIASDVSRAALALARRNAQAHGVAGRIDFIESDLLDDVPRQLDLIVANLPYVPTRLYRNLPPELRDHEPQTALHAGRRGTAVIEALLSQARGRLRPGGLLVAEHALNQGRRLREAARAAFPDARIETERDLAGRERVLVVSTEENRVNG